MVYILQVQPSSGSYKTVNVITQEDFEKMAPRAPRKVNPEVPPPPPPSLTTAPEFPTTQQLDEDTLLENVSQVKQSLLKKVICQQQVSPVPIIAVTIVKS